MFERYIIGISTESADQEEPLVLRERLKAKFAPGTTRRMTLLGMLVGSVLEELGAGEEDTLVYASSFGETRALETFLDSFPDASPTYFQTSIHPSGVQQGLIGKQKSIRQVYPLACGANLPGIAVRAALLADTERVLLCGGEERATWMTDKGIASGRTYAYALSLSPSPGSQPIGKLELRNSTKSGAHLSPDDWFDLLHKKLPFEGLVLPAVELRLTWI
jgi:hypothetical protein